MFQIAKEAEEFEIEQAKLLEENPYVNHNAAMLKAILKEKGKHFVLCVIFINCILYTYTSIFITYIFIIFIFLIFIVLGFLLYVFIFVFSFLTLICFRVF